MIKLMGKIIELYLCNSKDEYISGIMFDHDDDSIYLRDNNYSIIAVFKSNVKFCIEKNTLPVGPGHEVEKISNILSVNMDGRKIADIKVNSDINLASCSSELIDIAYSDDRVKAALSGKIQKSIEYDVGEMNIITADFISEPESQFSLSNDFGVSNKTLNPSDMVFRIGRKK